MTRLFQRITPCTKSKIPFGYRPVNRIANHATITVTDGGDVEKHDHDEVGDGHEDLDQRKPPIEIAGGVGIVVVEVHGLLVGGGRVTIVHERDVRRHPIA